LTRIASKFFIKRKKRLRRGWRPCCQILSDRTRLSNPGRGRAAQSWVFCSAFRVTSFSQGFWPMSLLLPQVWQKSKVMT